MGTVISPTAAPEQGRGARIPAAIEEVLRFSSPVQMDARYSLRDVDVRGHVIPKHSVAILWLGAANRDEDVFVDGERFDIGREDNRHITFGFGPHYCLGANLARLEGQVALRTLLRRTRRFTRTDDGPLPIHPSLVFRGVTALPLRMERA